MHQNQHIIAECTCIYILIILFDCHNLIETSGINLGCPSEFDHTWFKFILWPKTPNSSVATQKLNGIGLVGKYSTCTLINNVYLEVFYMSIVNLTQPHYRAFIYYSAISMKL